MDSEAVRERESCMGIPGWERQQGLALTKELERTEYNIPCLMSLSNVSNVFHSKYIDIVALIMDSPVHLQLFLSTRPNRNINYRNPTTSYVTVTVL